MTNDDMLVAAQDAHLLVKNYAQSIDSFILNVNDNVSALMGTLSVLNENWNDELYQDFAANVRNKVNGLNNELARAQTLEDVLKATAIELEDAIETLRAASEA